MVVSEDGLDSESPSARPPVGAGVTNGEAGNVQDMADTDRCSGYSGRQSAHTGAITNRSQGMVILKQAGETQAMPGTVATIRSNSVRFQGTAANGEVTVPDLESLRRGPRIRHSRLPQSPSMATNSAWQLPRGTKEMWGVINRLRNMVIISAVLLELSTLSLVSSVTAVATSELERGYPLTGLVAWAAVSGASVVVFGVVLGLAIFQYRKTGQNLVSGETWIEMHHRSRALPPRPNSEEREQDAAATEAWKKFVQDHEQLRRYVEFLETRVGVLEERQPETRRHKDEPSADAIRATSDVAGSTENDTVRLCRGGHEGTTPTAKDTNMGDSLSQRELLQPEGTAAESQCWRDGERSLAVPKSETRTSILTELCEAVTEGYSPLSEHMPREPSHTVQTADNGTPCARARGSTGRYLALPSKAKAYQGGFRPAD